ncbi:MAG TPA: tryptophan 7-halogenase [Candidatus Acidoferrales bacterium]|nr:tryptophan 7-halogenase [Candidatus Acidoferrales bacterium]
MATDILIMGGGATGHLAAAYLRKRFPRLSISVIEGPRKNRPIVGESFVEITVDFLLELGLGQHLIEEHFPKYGLTYYFKPEINNPADRTYVVDETPTVPPLLSFQVNRFTLDREVRRRNLETGVEIIDGSVIDVALHTQTGGEELHSVTFQDSEMQRSTVQARYLIDATGRNRVLQKKLQLEDKVEEQKNVFWFRLANFNPEILSRINTLKKENRAFVPYFATHHFFGRGNWIWCIPMRSPDGTPLISIGITYRRDVYPYVQLRNMEQFLECVGREHEVIADLVRSGTVVDTNSYNSYMWECRQHYSPDRWYILGDAGDTVDPLYSVGMALSSVQIRQIGAIIERESSGHDIREFTHDLDTAITALHHSLTRDTTRLYECMGDAYECHLRVHLVVTELFHMGLPLLMNGYLWDPVGVKIFNRFASLKSLEADAKSFQVLIEEVAAEPKNRALENFIKVQSSASMNNSFYEYHRDRDIPASLSRMFFSLARLRLSLLAKLGWQGCLRFRQHGAFLKDVFRSLCMLALRGRMLRENELVRWLISPPKVSAAPAKPVADPRPSKPVIIRTASSARLSTASLPRPPAQPPSSQLSR